MRDAKGRFVKVPVDQLSSPMPTFRSSWPYFVGLVGIAIAWYDAAPLIVLATVVASPFVLLWWLERTGHHTAAYFLYAILTGIIDGLFNRRSRWRRW